MTTAEFVSKFNYDGNESSRIRIARYAKDIEDNPILVACAVALLEAEGRRLAMLSDFNQELVKIGFPTWD